jgi:hypothetical protein
MLQKPFTPGDSMIPSSDYYKIVVYIPENHADKLMDGITGCIKPMYPGYDRVFTITPVKGTWRPLDGSNPYDGRVGEISTADETRIEFAVHGDDLKSVIERIVSIHPYEEPAIDIFPMIGWKTVTGRL